MLPPDNNRESTVFTGIKQVKMKSESSSSLGKRNLSRSDVFDRSGGCDDLTPDKSYISKRIKRR